jgi:hypothetical protein
MVPLLGQDQEELSTLSQLILATIASVALISPEEVLWKRDGGQVEYFNNRLVIKQVIYHWLIILK